MEQAFKGNRVHVWNDVEDTASYQFTEMKRVNDKQQSHRFFTSLINSFNQSKMKPFGVKYVSEDLRYGDAYTSMDYKKNPQRKKSRSYNNPTSKRILRYVKKKERVKIFLLD